MAESGTKKNIFAKIGEFFKNLKGELKKIAWPTLNQTVKQTIVVIVISAILCLFIGLIDMLSKYGVSALSTIIK